MVVGIIGWSAALASGAVEWEGATLGGAHGTTTARTATRAHAYPKLRISVRLHTVVPGRNDMRRKHCLQTPEG